MGECSKGVSGKAGIPQGSFRGLCGSAGSLTQCMAVPLSRRRLPQRQQWSARRGGWVREKIGKRVKLKEATLTSRVSQANRQTYVTLNRPRLFFNHNESCLERACCLLVACLSGGYSVSSQGADYAQQFITEVKRDMIIISGSLQMLQIFPDLLLFAEIISISAICHGHV